MHKYIERTSNVEGDGNCCYRAVLTLLDNGEYNHTLVRHQLIPELRTRKESYTQLYEKKENFDEVYASLVIFLNGPAPKKKWTRFPEMGNLIACACDRVCINLLRYGFSETFFPLRTAAP